MGVLGLLPRFRRVHAFGTSIARAGLMLGSANIHRDQIERYLHSSRNAA